MIAPTTWTGMLLVSDTKPVGIESVRCEDDSLVSCVNQGLLVPCAGQIGVFLFGVFCL